VRDQPKKSAKTIRGGVRTEIIPGVLGPSSTSRVIIKAKKKPLLLRHIVRSFEKEDNP
jgi:hypothetical protein